MVVLVNQAKSLLASELFAISQGSLCSGEDSCHWCSAPCPRSWPHDDSAILPFMKSRFPAKRPGNAYVCSACWLYQRKRITVQFLDNSFVDGQTASNHSWWITSRGAWGLQATDYKMLLDLLLQPPAQFVLSLITDKTITNYLQLALANNMPAINVETTFAFTINNIPHTYTIYELEQAIRHGSAGRLPGVQALCKLCALPEPADMGKAKVVLPRGRPPKDDGRVLKRSISPSP